MRSVRPLFVPTQWCHAAAPPIVPDHTWRSAWLPANPLNLWSPLACACHIFRWQVEEGGHRERSGSVTPFLEPKGQCSCGLAGSQGCTQGCTPRSAGCSESDSAGFVQGGTPGVQGRRPRGSSRRPSRLATNRAGRHMPDPTHEARAAAGEALRRILATRDPSRRWDLVGPAECSDRAVVAAAPGEVVWTLAAPADVDALLDRRAA